MTDLRAWAIPVLLLFSTTIYLPTVVKDGSVFVPTPTVGATLVSTPTVTASNTPSATPTPSRTPGGTIPDVTATPTASPAPEVNTALDLLVQADEVPTCFEISVTETFTPTDAHGWGASVLYEEGCTVPQPYHALYQRVQLYDTEAQAAEAYDTLRTQYDTHHEVVLWALDGFNETFGYATQSGADAYWYFTVARTEHVLVTTGLLYPAASNAILNPTWNFYYSEIVLDHIPAR